MIIDSEKRCAGKSQMELGLKEGTGKDCMVRATKKYHLHCQQWQKGWRLCLRVCGWAQQHKVTGLNSDFGNQGHRLILLKARTGDLVKARLNSAVPWVLENSPEWEIPPPAAHLCGTKPLLLIPDFMEWHSWSQTQPVPLGSEQKTSPVLLLTDLL